MNRNGHSFDPGPVLEHFEDATAREVAEVLGVSIDTVHAWRQGRRGLRAHHADELAIKLLGTHPALVWGEAWWQFKRSALA